MNLETESAKQSKCISDTIMEFICFHGLVQCLVPRSDISCVSPPHLKWAKCFGSKQGCQDLVACIFEPTSQKRPPRNRDTGLNHRSALLLLNF